MRPNLNINVLFIIVALLNTYVTSDGDENPKGIQGAHGTSGRATTPGTTEGNLSLK